jgi:hypothetical protein
VVWRRAWRQGSNGGDEVGTHVQGVHGPDAKHCWQWQQGGAGCCCCQHAGICCTLLLLDPAADGTGGESMLQGTRGGGEERSNQPPVAVCGRRGACCRHHQHLLAPKLQWAPPCCCCATTTMLPPRALAVLLCPPRRRSCIGPQADSSGAYCPAAAATSAQPGRTKTAARLHGCCSSVGAASLAADRLLQHPAAALGPVLPAALKQPLPRQPGVPAADQALWCCCCHMGSTPWVCGSGCCCSGGLAGGSIWGGAANCWNCGDVLLLLPALRAAAGNRPAASTQLLALP